MSSSSGKYVVEVRPSQFDTAIEIARNSTYPYQRQLLLNQQAAAEKRVQRRQEAAAEDWRYVVVHAAEITETKIGAVAADIEKHEARAHRVLETVRTEAAFERAQRALVAQRRQEVAQHRRAESDAARINSIVADAKRREKHAKSALSAVEAQRMAVVNARFDAHQEQRRQLGRESRAFWFRRWQEEKGKPLVVAQRVHARPASATAQRCESSASLILDQSSIRRQQSPSPQRSVHFSVAEPKASTAAPLVDGAARRPATASVLAVQAEDLSRGAQNALHEAEREYLAAAAAEAAYQQRIGDRSAAVKAQIAASAKQKRRDVAKRWITWEGAQPPFVPPKPVTVYGRKLTAEEDRQQAEYVAYIARQERLYAGKRAVPMEERVAALEQAERKRSAAVERAHAERLDAVADTSAKLDGMIERAQDRHQHLRDEVNALHQLTREQTEAGIRRAASRKARELQRALEASEIHQEDIDEHRQRAQRRQDDAAAEREDRTLEKMQGSVRRLAAKMMRT